MLRRIMDYELPPVIERCRIPVLHTASKLEIEALNNNPLEDFLDSCCYTCPGCKVPFSDFFERFTVWLPGRSNTFSVRQVSKMLKETRKYCLGRGSRGTTFIGNLSFDPNEKCDGRYVCNDGKLRLERQDTNGKVRHSD